MYTVMLYEGDHFFIVGSYPTYDDALAQAYAALAAFRERGTEERAWVTIMQGRAEVKRLDTWVKREG